MYCVSGGGFVTMCCVSLSFRHAGGSYSSCHSVIVIFVDFLPRPSFHQRFLTSSSLPSKCHAHAHQV